METSECPTEPVADWFAHQGAEMMRLLGIRPGDSVLDFGCGPGRYAIPLCQAVGRGGSVVALERDMATIVELRERIERLVGTNTVDVRLSNTCEVTSLFEPESFDSVLLFDVLQYVDDWDALFGALAKVLRREGRIHIYPAALPHPGSVDIGVAAAKLRQLGFSGSNSRQFAMMHNVEFVTDTVHSYWRNFT